MTNHVTQELLNQISKGTDFSYLDDQFEEIKNRLNSFADKHFSCSLFISGSPGSGKTYTIQRALKEANLKDLWIVRIDCRLFDNDHSAMKEFFRQTGSQQSKNVLDALKLLGSGIIIFDHFDSLKIIKRQFFLYTLFDSIHTNSVALCCVLVTSSYEPLNNLEKRVKSRFTPTTIDFPPPTQFDMDNFIPLLTATEASKLWNNNVKSLFTKQPKKSRIIHPFDRLFMLVPSLHTVMIFAKKIALLASKNKLTIRDLETTVDEILNTINPSRFLEGMSHVDLIVAFTTVYMRIVKQINDFSFDMLTEEIETQMKPYRFAKVLSFDRIRISWDKLVSMKILVYATKDETRVSPTLFEDDIEPFISHLPTEGQVWAQLWLKKSYSNKNQE
ncbi:hypothetical protein TRFO_31405 [Tritrichomonas foetus]|uniref:Uncharacterized protein n=1 Tax=Tritrichomonas foetus TaxID=1144522 RepID=A0A1J4JRB7_9EUKA|nr:hypothetical protein TRFO_31405 [Tritrichomonas foetus]|eukprot:OHT01703.1 hypothetical protein TRFO_31405 [Tritrichomonas foetus]